MNSITQKDIDRFWGHVDKEISQIFYNGSRCWEWTASCSPDGYGQVRISGKTELTHRVAWTIANGSIPDNFQVLHHCDNPPCVNPSHLFLGTNQDNVDDKMEKGREGRAMGDRNGSRTHPESYRDEKHWSHRYPEKVARGEKNGYAKLTWEQVREIRRRYAWFGIGGDSLPKLAKDFGVHPTTIHDIVKNKVWKE